MVITVLEADVADSHLQDLETAYRDALTALPPGLVETFLVRDSSSSTSCRIITVWASREDLERMRSSGEKPKGVQVFEAAGATPTLSVLEVVAHGRSA